MLSHQLRILSSCLFFITASSPLLHAQDRPQDQPTAEMRCGGQYECVEERLLTPAEARASIAFPKDSAEEAKVASTKQKPAN